MLKVGTTVHVLEGSGYSFLTCHAAVIVRNINKGKQIDLYRLPYPGYKNREEDGELLLDVNYNPSCDVPGAYHTIEGCNKS